MINLTTVVMRLSVVKPLIVDGSGLGATGVVLIGSCFDLGVNGVGLGCLDLVRWAHAMLHRFLSSTILARILFARCALACFVMKSTIRNFLYHSIMPLLCFLMIVGRLILAFKYPGRCSVCSGRLTPNILHHGIEFR